MLLHIANLYDSSRRTAIAGEAIPLGSVIKLSAAPNGDRRALAVVDADSALLVPGNYGVATKISTELLQVTTSNNVPVEWGTRLVTIYSGDAIIEVARGAILEYDPSLLHNSLNPSQGGALPAVGAALAIKNGKFCATGTAGAIASPVIARVHGLVGSKVRIELV
jgi:hypothetical protein